MILVTHILIALSSVGYSGYTLYAPSQSKLKVSYGLIALTVMSGTYLIWSMQSQMLHACLEGLAFVAVSVTCAALARHRLSAVSVHTD